MAGSVSADIAGSGSTSPRAMAAKAAASIRGNRGRLCALIIISTLPQSARVRKPCSRGAGLDQVKKSCSRKSLPACCWKTMSGFRSRAHSVFERSMPSDLIRGWTPVRVKKTRQTKAPLVLDDHRGADGDAAIEIGHVVIGHAEAAR